MALRQSFAVIPTHDRPDEFARCVEAIRPQVDTIIAVCHCGADFTPVHYAASLVDKVIIYPTQGRANISHMWNLGLDEAASLATGPYDVAVLNDDAIPGPDWFATVNAAMHADGAQGASEPRCPGSAMCAGWAFILNGDAGLRADEQFVHWCGDDDMHRQAARWAIVEGVTTPNTLANSTSQSAEALAQIRLDIIAFNLKWAHM